MSGGSYGYLAAAIDDAADLANHREMLRAMATRLKDLGYLEAAVRTAAVACKLSEVETAAQYPGLADVWHAVEWMDSYDWSEEQAREVLDGFNGGIR